MELKSFDVASQNTFSLFSDERALNYQYNYKTKCEGLVVNFDVKICWGGKTLSITSDWLHQEQAGALGSQCAPTQNLVVRASHVHTGREMAGRERGYIERVMIRR